MSCLGLAGIIRDPIEEEGGLNLYNFCKNTPFLTYDKDGRAYFAYRPLGAIKWLGVIKASQDDLLNTVVGHENLFFEDGKAPSNLGYFPDGVHPDRSNYGYHFPHASGFNDCIMRKAVSLIRPLPYSLLGSREKAKYNCQDWAEEVRLMYFSIKTGWIYYPKSTTFLKALK